LLSSHARGSCEEEIAPPSAKRKPLTVSERGACEELHGHISSDIFEQVKKLYLYRTFMLDLLLFPFACNPFCSANPTPTCKNNGRLWKMLSSKLPFKEPYALLTQSMGTTLLPYFCEGNHNNSDKKRKKLGDLFSLAVFHAESCENDAKLGYTPNLRFHYKNIFRIFKALIVEVFLLAVHKRYPVDRRKW
jgi:hypothetical protein